MRRATSTDDVVGTGPVQLASVNLLPPEVAQQRSFRKVQTGLAAAVVAALVVVALLFHSAGSDVSSSNDDLAAADAQHSSVQTQLSRYTGVTATYARVASTQALLATAMGQEVRYSGFLNDLSQTLPPNVWITNIAFSQAVPAATAATSPAGAAATTSTGIGTLAVTGLAYSHNDVASWLETLAAEKGYGIPLLSSSTLGLNGPKVLATWSTIVPLTPAALSGRYTTAGS